MFVSRTAPACVCCTLWLETLTATVENSAKRNAGPRSDAIHFKFLACFLLPLPPLTVFTLMPGKLVPFYAPNCRTRSLTVQLMYSLMKCM